jgi:arabinogalactan oligomer / maltooligosaccharide transport system permease protein
MIDGANQWQIFFKVFLPLAKPIIIYTALMAFMAPWTDFILAGLILRDPESMTVAVGLYNMTLENRISTQFTMFAAGCILVAIPIVGFYLSLQRFMIEGISVGAVKG